MCVNLMASIARIADSHVGLRRIRVRHQMRGCHGWVTRRHGGHGGWPVHRCFEGGAACDKCRLSHLVNIRNSRSAARTVRSLRSIFFSISEKCGVMTLGIDFLSREYRMMPMRSRVAPHPSGTASMTRVCVVCPVSENAPPAKECTI